MQSKRMLRDFQILIVLFLLGTILNTKVYAQQNPWINKGPPSTFLKAVTLTENAVFTGENDSRTWLQPYNGIYKSENFGETWLQSGLAGRGITDIAYTDKTLYATTRFVKEQKVGLFTSLDQGQTWQHQPNLNFSMFAVDARDSIILIGGASHGLWISTDRGETWQQKLGDGIGPDIFDVFIGTNVFLAVAPNDVYISYDQGETWETLPFLTGKQIRQVYIQENTLFAASHNTNGLFRSLNLGQTWQQVPEWQNSVAGAIVHHKNQLYAAKKTLTGKFDILQSGDNGNTWHSTNMTSLGNIYAMAGLYLENSYIFAVTQYEGLYRKIHEPIPQTSEQFLEFPFDTSVFTHPLDMISSVFDHQYPLVGYSYQVEPANTQNTTVDFIGSELPEDDLWYSSHNGVDFALPLGTPILAPAEGYASYYYCEDCGHSIIINHQNGFQTIFYHLQEDGLITTNSTPVWVETHTPIGKVGLTGNTNGPHVHMSVKKDPSQIFLPGFPDKLVDPFGWLNLAYVDPWPQYTWTDILGNHNGSTSTYLWTEAIPQVQEYIQTSAQSIILENKKIEVTENTFSSKVTLAVQNFPAFAISHAQAHLVYIPTTGILLHAFTYLGNNVTQLQEPLTIEIDFSATDLINVLPQSLKIYYFDLATSAWHPLETVVLDLINYKIKAKTTHLSQFAVLGTKIDAMPPTTTISLTGSQENEWYTEFPMLTLTTNEPGTVLYKYGDEVDWYTYIQPITLTREGVFSLEYRALDNAENIEETKTVLVKVDTLDKHAPTLKVTNSQFNL